MKKYISLLLVLTLAVTMLAGCADSGKAADTSLGQSENVVILVLDALSSQYLSRMGSNSSFAKLARSGAANLKARCTYPSSTLTNHAAIMTGTSAGAHGIVGDVRPAADGGIVMSQAPEMLQRQTIFELAAAQGLKTAVIAGEDSLVTLFSKDCTVAAGKESAPDYLGAAPDPDDALTDKEYCERNLELADWVFESLYTVLEKEAANLTLASVPALDQIGHRFGPDSDEMKTCLKHVDKALGKLYDKMKKSGMLENTTLIIVSDHGMTATDKTIDLNALTAASFPQAAAASDGRTGYIWLNGTDELDVVISFADMEGIASIFSRRSDIAVGLGIASTDGPDLIMETEAGYAFLSDPVASSGAHGSSGESDMVVPMVMVGGGIPAGAGIDECDLRAVAPLVCKLLGISGGDFEASRPDFLPQQDLSAFKN